MPTLVTSIDCAAFACCSSLTRIVVPDSVARIDKHAFSHCSSLAILRLPKNPNLAIGDNAFVGCGALSTIELPYRMELSVWSRCLLKQFSSNGLFARIGLSEVGRRTCAFNFLRKRAPQLFEDRTPPAVVRQRAREEPTP